jgi:hypothetical protein
VAGSTTVSALCIDGLVARSAARRALPGEASPDQPDALGRKCIRRRSTVTNWEKGLGGHPRSRGHRPRGRRRPVRACVMCERRALTSKRPLSALVPAQPSARRRIGLIDLQHRSTLLVLHDGSRSTPTEESKHDQDDVSKSHNVLPRLLRFDLSRVWKHATIFPRPAPRKMYPGAVAPVQPTRFLERGGTTGSPRRRSRIQRLAAVGGRR